MKDIKYPSGTVVCCGDLVWWNGGKNVGLVTAIYDESEARQQLAIQESCLEISNEISTPRQGGGGVIYRTSSLSEDGIEKLTLDEEAEVRTIVQRETVRGRCRVSLEFDSDRAIMIGEGGSRVSRLIVHSLPHSGGGAAETGPGSPAR